MWLTNKLLLYKILAYADIDIANISLNCKYNFTKSVLNYFIPLKKIDISQICEILKEYVDEYYHVKCAICSNIYHLSFVKSMSWCTKQMNGVNCCGYFPVCKLDFNNVYIKQFNFIECYI